MTTSQLLPQVAAAELLRRRAARVGLLAFTQYTFARYQADPVHTLIASALDRVQSGECSRLMIFAPPQHGKSELVSVRLPAYWLGRRPDDPVIITSYGGDLAVSKSRQVRDIVRSDEYKALFGDLSPVDVPVAIRADSQSVANWHLARHRGSLLAVGVGGPVTGHPAALGVIDDPFANWEQAQSAGQRNRVWDWYRGTFRTRIWEYGAIVLIMTRWHMDDLAGRLLADQPGEWKVLRLPATAETQEDRDFHDHKMQQSTGRPDPLGRAPGEPLAPSRYSSTALARIRRDVGSMVWGAEYQGAPTAAEGTMVKRDWLKIVTAPPREVVATVRYWDKAGSTSASAKYTAGVRLAYSADGLIYIEHVVHGKWETGDRRKVMLQTAQADGTQVLIGIEQEPGSSGLDSVRDEQRLLVGYAVFADRPSGDKDTRMQPFVAQAEGGAVRLVAGEWNQDYIDELCSLPNGAYRDQADATSGALNRLREYLETAGGLVVYDEELQISPY